MVSQFSGPQAGPGYNLWLLSLSWQKQIRAVLQPYDLRHIEFVSLSQDRALVVLVFSDGHVENRLFHPPPGQTPSSMREAANFLNAIVEGKKLRDLRHTVRGQIERRRAEIDALAVDLDDGLAAASVEPVLGDANGHVRFLAFWGVGLPPMSRDSGPHCRPPAGI